MTSPEDSPRTPSESQRLAARVRSIRQPVMYQQWRDLLFLHWIYPATTIQKTLPEGLFVDTYGGEAYLGVVPFFMQNIRPRFLPTAPGISNFLELNLRTYVHDRSGVPGVWFYSLDANQRLAVEIARRLFHLPYEHAEMTASRTEADVIRYRSVRRGGGAKKRVACEFAYAPGKELPLATPGSLEFFLIERYWLYASAGGQLRRGAVFHQPYPLCGAELMAYDEELLALNGFTPTGRPPDHRMMSRGVDVTIFPLERVAS